MLYAGQSSLFAVAALARGQISAYIPRIRAVGEKAGRLSVLGIAWLINMPLSRLQTTLLDAYMRH